ncbi:MAG: IS701 family transposase [Dehalococcoidia bacterium]
MPASILPDSFLGLLTAFQPCFHAPSSRNFQLLVSGWIQGLGRRTVTAVVLAAGAVGQHHSSVFHRFFSRAQWSLDAVGRVVFTLALAWLPTDAPLYLLVDDTLARKHGNCIGLASLHHDPVLSTGRKPFTSFGHVWVTLALWVPLPMGQQRGFALPLLFRLYTGSKRGGEAAVAGKRAGKRQRAAQTAHASAPRRTKLELARELIDLIAGWAGERTLYVVADSAYAGRMLLEARPANVHSISRLRLDAALWSRPPKRRMGQKGRPRRRGRRLPTPQALAATRRHWQRVAVSIYGRTVTTQAFTLTALWYAALRDQPVRIVVVRDPRGRRQDEACFCTDLTVDAPFVLEGSARRWTLEVTYHDSKQWLGLEDPQNQTSLAVQRTAPMAFLVYDLVLLWYAGRSAEPQAPTWVQRPWYRQKTTPSFLDMLTALRREGWQRAVSGPAWPARRPQNAAAAWCDAVLATA